MFTVIPVLDLIDGQAVLARAGERDRYAPLDTPLCHSSDPLRVVAAYLALFPFRHLYVADLDAIRGAAPDGRSIDALRRGFPALQIWLDAGFRDAAVAAAFAAAGIRPVLGSESLSDTAVLDAVPAPVLSLDYAGDTFRGPAGLATDAGRWPRDVIVMSLARIGDPAGPDWPRLEQVRQRASANRLYAAGGVRGLRDLRRLMTSGYCGALLASALHRGDIGRAELEAIAGVPDQPGT